MGVLDNLEPRDVMHYFEEISQIPRPSREEKAISDYLAAFAAAHGLPCVQDGVGNIIITKEASPGYEDQPAIVLQGHMDMVCETAPGVEKDMTAEPPELEIDGEFIRAKGTTLGGDDGIALAYSLALLANDGISHPRLEFVATVGEEIGMVGARALDGTPVSGRRLLNLDSEVEGVVLAGCAGGGTATVTLPVKCHDCGWKRLMVHISGLLGGHSGTDIDKGRTTSIELIGRLLRLVSEKTPIRLLSMENGSKDNAISREGRVVLAVKEPAALESAAGELEKTVRREYRAADPDIRIEIAPAETVAGVSRKADPLTKKSTRTIIALLSALPQGVLRMSDATPGMVETSLNWGVATLGRKDFTMQACLRSNVDSSLNALIERVRWIAESEGADFRIDGVYPAWEWVDQSTFREKIARIYREQFGKDLQITAIHAGVECGLLSAKLPGMDAISMGPDILDIHTPQERLSIPSVDRTWQFLVRLIEMKD